MSILAQHGAGKKDRIEKGIENGSIQGVIMSPRDETPEKMKLFLSNIGDIYPETERIVDPQLYAGNFQLKANSKLRKYKHVKIYQTPDFFTRAETRTIVRLAKEWQKELEVSAFVSPTVIVDDLGGPWARIAKALAKNAITEHDSTKPLLISLVVREEALRQRDLVDSWLDGLTRLDADGFYLIIHRSAGAYQQRYEPEILSSMLRICYSLAELNEYRVLLGYSDMVTLLLHSVGVEGTGSGWNFNLRQFDTRRFQPGTKGRQPRPRYTSRALLNCIYISELDGIYSGGRAAEVLSETPYDDRFRNSTNPENVPWPKDEAAFHHWSVLADISRLKTGAGVAERLDAAYNQIERALDLYAQFEELMVFTSETGPDHLYEWLVALKRFRSEVAV